jgi:hypothetical protein
MISLGHDFECGLVDVPCVCVHATLHHHHVCEVHPFSQIVESRVRKQGAFVEKHLRVCALRAAALVREGDNPLYPLRGRTVGKGRGTVVSLGRPRTARVSLMPPPPPTQRSE